MSSPRAKQCTFDIIPDIGALGPEQPEIEPRNLQDLSLMVGQHVH